MSDTKTTIHSIIMLHLNFIVTVVWKISFHFIQALWCTSNPFYSYRVSMGQKHVFEVIWDSSVLTFITKN